MRQRLTCIGSIAIVSRNIAQGSSESAATSKQAAGSKAKARFKQDEEALSKQTDWAQAALAAALSARKPSDITQRARLVLLREGCTTAFASTCSYVE